MDEERTPLCKVDHKQKHSSARNSANNYSDMESERSSMIGTSVTYEEHLNMHSLEQRNSALTKLKLLTALSLLGFIGVFGIAMMANGAFFQTAISKTGCNIGLDSWYYGLSGISLYVSLVQTARLVIFKWHN